MIADLVPARDDFLDQLGETLRPDIHEEKRRFYLVLIENVQYPARFVPAPRGVKADGDFVVAALHTVDGQLPLSGDNLRAARVQGVNAAQRAQHDKR